MACSSDQKRLVGADRNQRDQSRCPSAMGQAGWREVADPRAPSRRFSGPFSFQPSWALPSSLPPWVPAWPRVSRCLRLDGRVRGPPAAPTAWLALVWDGLTVGGLVAAQPWGV